MREIKFRVWNPTANKWLHRPGWEVNLFGETIVLGELCHGLSLDEIGQLVALQYTGLKDRNGKEIYEGDIIKWGDLKNSHEDEIRIAEVKINPDIQFDCKNIKYPFVFHYGRFAYSSDQLKVIGNIYENPELLATQRLKQ